MSIPCNDINLVYQEILSNYEVLRGEFPGAKLMASTFDNFIEALQPIKGQLPVVEVEVGDTWVQGISSDPVKMARYWAFANKLQVCVRKGGYIHHQVSSYMPHASGQLPAPC